MDIMISESYILTGDTDILVYLITSIVKLINNIKETKIITVKDDIMERGETSELILVDIPISRMYSDVLSRFWTSHREGV